MVSCEFFADAPGHSGTSPPVQTPLTIWWEKGFNAAEDEAIQTLVAQWEQKSGHQVHLLLLPSDTLVQKTQRALRAGQPPDILYASKGDYELYPRLAAANKLADVSELLAPVQDHYDPNILRAASLWQKQRYYAVPFAQYTLYMHYWKHLVAQTNRDAEKLPQSWQGFWALWQQVQTDLRAAGQSDIYGLGLTLSKTSGDTYIFFEQLLEAHDVQLLDEAGQPRVWQPEVKVGIERCLNWSVQLFKQGYVPPEAQRWLNPDNNRQLLNQAVVMTPNSTLSIPTAVRHDTKLYRERLGTAEFPNKPSGAPMRYIQSIKQVVIFADTPALDAAKAFLGDFIQPEVMGEFLQDVGGRYLPVSNRLLASPQWSQTDDPHLAIATRIITQRPTRLHYSVIHPAYARVQEQKVWGKALHRVLAEDWSPAQATDEAIAAVQAIFQEWDETKQAL